MEDTSLNPLQLEQERKVARRLLKSPEGLQALRDVTGYNLVLPGESAIAHKPVVIILTPSHKGIAPEAQSAIERMIRASSNHAVVVPDPYVHSSVVSWGRNELLARLFKSGRAFDYVLWIDDDMVPQEDALVKLLAHDVEIVSAACTTRYDPPKPNWRIYKPDTFSYHTALDWSREGLIPYGGVGTGFLLVKRAALEKIADYYWQCAHLKRYLLSPITIGAGGKVQFAPFDESRLPDWLQENLRQLETWRFEEMQKTHNAWWFEFLKNPVGEGEWGEDISFCHKAHTLGIPMYVDTTVRVGHLGNYAYGIDNYLECREAVIEEQRSKEMFAAVVGEATSTPQVEQPFKPTKKVSVLIPSRGRPEMLQRTLTSLYANATGEIQVLVRFDDDAFPTGGYFPTCDYDPSSLYIMGGPRHGYKELNKYYDELAQQATGDWLLIFNDDAVMQTPGWDAKIHEQGGGLKVLNAGDRLNLFPIVSQELYGLLGTFGPGTHVDSSLQVISRLNGIEYPVDIRIQHLRDDIDDATKTESLATYAQSRPEFFSAARQALLRADVEKVKAAL